MFTLEQIYCFNAVLETGSYSGAGKKLGKSRSTVREHVVALEDTTGLTLFEVDGKKLVPTRHARHIYQRASHLAKHARDLQETMSELYANPLTELVIYHDPLVPFPLISDISAAISERLPHLQVNWLCRTREQGYQGIKAGEVQMALMASENLAATSSEVAFLNLGTVIFGGYLSACHLLAEQRQVSVDDLRLVKQYMTESAAKGGLGSYPLSVHRQLVSDVTALLEMTACDGWAVLPHGLAQPFVDSGRLIRLNVEEMTQSQPHNICAFLPIYYRSHQQLGLVADIVKQKSRQHLA